MTIHSSPPDPANAGLHALIIEDELIIGLDLQAMLQPLGYESFAFASTTSQALEQARLRAPDLTTIDLGLLDGDGLKAAAALTAQCGERPTIFITGDPQSVLDERPDRVVLAKPITETDLRLAVDRAREAVPAL